MLGGIKMAFICEKLTEKDKEFIESFKFNMPLGRRDELAPIPEQWVRDKERGYYLICIAGQGDVFDNQFPPYYYRLIIGNSVVKIEGRYEGKGDFNIGISIKWRINSIIVPNNLKYISRDEILNIVREAFGVFGNIHECGHVVETIFDRISMPLYAN